MLNGEARRCEAAAGMDTHGEADLSLPERGAINRLPALPKAAPPKYQPCRSMLLDDDTFMHDLVKQRTRRSWRLCRGRLLRTSRVSGGLRCRLGPDAILLDINMPFMGGIQFIEQFETTQFPEPDPVEAGRRCRCARPRGWRRNSISRSRVDPQAAVAASPGPAAQGLRQEGERTGQAESGWARPTMRGLARGGNNGELVNYYQPKVAPPGGRVDRRRLKRAGIIRWMGWSCRIGSFPMAEVSGMIGDVTRVVLQAAVRQAHLWREAGLDLRVAINVFGG